MDSKKHYLTSDYRLNAANDILNLLKPKFNRKENFMQGEKSFDEEFEEAIKMAMLSRNSIAREMVDE